PWFPQTLGALCPAWGSQHCSPPAQRSCPQRPPQPVGFCPPLPRQPSPSSERWDQPSPHSTPTPGPKERTRTPLPWLEWTRPCLGTGSSCPPGVILTSSLIATRSLPQLLDPQSPESRPTELLPSSTIRLDHQNISAIGRLQSMLEVHSLYLQQNQIEKIENLSCFPNLRVLSLAGNRICRVENLQPLRHLRLLDLSHNHIQTLDPGELPCSLRLLDLRGNKCTQQHGYRRLVLGALPHLLELDTQPLRGAVGEEEEEGGSSSSEDEEDLLLSEPSSPFTAGKDFFVDLHQDLSRHSQQRQSEALGKHQTHLKELEELWERWDLLLHPAPLSPGREGAASTTAPGPRRPHPCPQAKPGTQLPPLPGPTGQPQQASSGSQLCAKALEEKSPSKGAGSRHLPLIPPQQHSSTQLQLKPLYSYTDHCSATEPPAPQPAPEELSTGSSA
ncbi:leucine-rich repeat-containing protein 46, partial [Melanerpes formicivorus]|uniref:leucine-rich repeat-containing protein 46-like n=1 Tax=Melanerpes formicivorus TaxID=211600 RepID=UPI00358F0ADA